MTLEKAIKRTDTVNGVTPRHKVSCGNLYITVNWDSEGNLIECFIRPSKSGGCWANLEGLGRMISLAMRYKIPIEEILKQLHGIRCPACSSIIAVENQVLKDKNNGKLPENFELKTHFSCPDSVARAITKAHKQLQKEVEDGKNLQKKM